MQRVITYIDGFNLYYALRENGWRRFYWLNLAAMSQLLLRSEQILCQVKYFTSIVTDSPHSLRRQTTYLEALETLPNLSIRYGHFLQDVITCRKCGFQYTTHHEKMTDVNIATELLVDALQDRFDVALLISGDSDLVGPIRHIKELCPNKLVVVVFPPGRHSSALKTTAVAYTYLSQATLRQSQFDDCITKPDGYIIQRPATWR